MRVPSVLLALALWMVGCAGVGAESLAHERLALKPESPINRTFLAHARTQAP